ncbi:hypothetical protein ACFSQT_14215 [Mesorhizobium calcicola]|uniref:Uncharacterized protein n=1 Tax=Mesorhizobium calcicola TaxID=1300310 RepID=A0ABW4WC49_9HYPH
MTVASVADEPEIGLTNWALVQHNGVGYRLVGAHEDTSVGRITSPIVAFNFETMTATTESGRRYILRGDSNPAAAHYIRGYLLRHGISVREVALADLDELVLLPTGIDVTLPRMQ